MKSLFLTVLLIFGIVFNAAADVWKWVDANGDSHYVDTNRPIYTWIDKFGKVHYSDKPDDADAIFVQLVWVSSATLDEVESKEEQRLDGDLLPGETAEMRAERKAAEKYYCERATEIYESYVNAPQLYRTNDNGEREYLSDKEAAVTVAETKMKMKDICE